MDLLFYYSSRIRPCIGLVIGLLSHNTGKKQKEKERNQSSTC